MQICTSSVNIGDIYFTVTVLNTFSLTTLSSNSSTLPACNLQLGALSQQLALDVFVGHFQLNVCILSSNETRVVTGLPARPCIAVFKNAFHESTQRSSGVGRREGVVVFYF